MAALARLVLLLQSIFWHLSMVGVELDEATRKHEEHLSQEMDQLLQELEQSRKEERGFAWQAVLFAALQQWQFWAVAGGLVLLLRFSCWWLRKKISEPGSSSRHGSPAEKEEEEGEEEEEDPSLVDGFLDVCMSWPVPGEEMICTMLEKVVNKLLLTCQVFSWKSFMPRLQPVVTLGGFRENPSAIAGDFLYCLLVPLKAPPGYSFRLEQDTEGEMPESSCHLRMDLECTCTKERCLGDVLCFVHRCEDELRMSGQDPSLLQTLCTNSYLDVQKTALRLQDLMREACKFRPQMCLYKLMVLPATDSCKMKLTNEFIGSLSIQLILAVQEGNSNTFVIID